MTANTTDKIIEAATELFSSRGYSCVSTKDIATRACVNEATLFRRFGNKRKVFSLCLNRMIDQATAVSYLEQVMSGNDFERDFRALAHAIDATFSRTYIRMLLSFGIELPGRDVGRWVSATLKPWYAPITRRLAREQASGRVRKGRVEVQVRSLVLALFGHAVARFTLTETYARLTKMRDSDVDHYLDIWLRGVDAHSHLVPRK